MAESKGKSRTGGGYGVPRHLAVNRSHILDDRHWFHALEVPACMLWEAPTPGMKIHEWQQDQCAGCGVRDELYRDHDHATGLLRGYLCPSCNVLEGVGESKMWDRWRSGWNPATILGVTIQHSEPTPNPAHTLNHANLKAPQNASKPPRPHKEDEAAGAGDAGVTRAYSAPCRRRRQSRQRTARR